MRFRGLDLNLLAMFALLMEERSVSRAARRLHLSQPTVSGALQRLREYFRDDLLIPQGRRMLATPLAEALWPQVTALLRSADVLLDGMSQFDPAQSSRTFRVAASDYMTMVLLRPVIQDLAALAPNVKVLIELPGDRTAGRLEQGQIDLLIGPEEFASPRNPAELLFEDRFVIVGARDNPALAQPLTTQDFTTLEHVTVLLGTDLPAAFADRQLDQLGITRRVGLTVPHFFVVPWMVAGTNRIGLMHERLALLARETLPITIIPLPFDFPRLREVVQHHRTRSGDPALGWLRRRLVEAGGLSPPLDPPQAEPSTSHRSSAS